MARSPFKMPTGPLGTSEFNEAERRNDIYFGLDKSPGSIKFLIRFPIAGCVQPNKLPQCGGAEGAGSTLKSYPQLNCISSAYFQVICCEFTTHVRAHVNTQWGKYFDYRVGAAAERLSRDFL